MAQSKEIWVNTFQRIVAALAAVGLAVLLTHAIVAPESADRRIPLAILAVASLVIFFRQDNFWLLSMVVPAGPVLDFAFLTPARGIYATEVVLLAAFINWLYYKAIGKSRGAFSKPEIPALLLMGFGLVGALALVVGHPESFHSFVAWRTLRVLLLAVGAVGLLREVVQSSNRNIHLAWAGSTLLLLLLIGVGGIAEFLVRHSGHFEAGSFYKSSIGLALHLAFFAPLAICVWLGPSTKRWKWLGASAWVAALACLPLTASRGALGSVLITSALAALVAVRRGRGQTFRGLAVALVLVLALLTILAAKPEIAGEAFAYKFRATMAGDFFSTRVKAWGEAWQGISQFPLVGEGPETWSPSVPLELARRHGIPAALLGLGAIFSGAWFAGKRAWGSDHGEALVKSGLHRPSLDWGLALGLVGLFFVGLAETGLGARLTPLLAWVIVLAGMGAEPGEPGSELKSSVK